MDDPRPLLWQEARQFIAPLNPRLAECIDAIAPDDQFCCYRLRIPYGSHIIKQGRLCLPDWPEAYLKDIGGPSIDDGITQSL